MSFSSNFWLDFVTVWGVIRLNLEPTQKADCISRIFIPKIDSPVSLLAFAVLITYSVKNGIILLVLAFLISPMGLPMLAVQGLGKLQDVNSAMKNFIHS